MKIVLQYIRTASLVALPIVGFWLLSVHADDVLLDTNERDPASVSAPTSSHRNYPGAADEDDLQVQAHLPEAAMKTDARSLQKEVYKTLYNQELKDDGRDAVEE